MALAAFGQNEFLDAVLGSGTPATFYVCLLTQEPVPSDTGTELVEPVGNAYARVAKTNDATNFPAASGGTKSNGTAVTFPAATGDWGRITHWAITDASTGGNLYFYADISSPKTIRNTDQPEFAVGNMTFQIT